jgi:hypothetical protein
LKTLKSGIEESAKGTSFGDIDSTLESVHGGNEDAETEASDGGLKTFEGRVEQCTECTSLGDVNSALKTVDGRNENAEAKSSDSWL